MKNLFWNKIFYLSNLYFETIETQLQAICALTFHSSSRILCSNWFLKPKYTTTKQICQPTDYQYFQTYTYSKRKTLIRRDAYVNTIDIICEHKHEQCACVCLCVCAYVFVFVLCGLIQCPSALFVCIESLILFCC